MNEDRRAALIAAEDAWYAACDRVDALRRQLAEAEAAAEAARVALLAARAAKEGAR